MVHDVKIGRLKPDERWVWIVVLAAARESCEPGTLLVSEGEPFDVADLARFGQIDVPLARRGVDRMLKLGLIEIGGDTGAWIVPRWKERQFETDDVAKRTQKHRSQERERNVPIDREGTDQRTETEDREFPLTPTADAVGGSRVISQRSSRANGTNPRAIAANTAADRACLERLASAERWGINQAAVCPDRSSLDDAICAQKLEADETEAAIRGWEASLDQPWSAKPQNTPDLIEVS
jgi:hypothetical protein